VSQRASNLDGYRVDADQVAVDEPTNQVGAHIHDFILADVKG
jgi:hypothetical protein